MMCCCQPSAENCVSAAAEAEQLKQQVKVTRTRTSHIFFDTKMPNSTSFMSTSRNGGSGETMDDVDYGYGSRSRR